MEGAECLHQYLNAVCGNLDQFFSRCRQGYHVDRPFPLRTDEIGLELRRAPLGRTAAPACLGGQGTNSLTTPAHFPELWIGTDLLTRRLG
jgi:hypothetical protein